MGNNKLNKQTTITFSCVIKRHRSQGYYAEGMVIISSLCINFNIVITSPCKLSHNYGSTTTHTRNALIQSPLLFYNNNNTNIN